MKNKKIFFNKKKNKINVIIYIIIIISFIIIYYYYYYNNNKKIFIIPEFKSKYYIIPKDKGGKKILDFGISILENKSIQDTNNKYDFNLKNINYSIQLYASNSLEKIENKIEFLSADKSLKKDKFYIGELISNVGKSYLILYNNYNKRESAKKDCDELKHKGIKCLVINVQKL